MIEINLLPQELQLRNRSVKTDFKKLFYLIPLGLGILLAVNIYLGLANIASGHKYNELNKKWNELEPQRAETESVNKEHNKLFQDAQAVRRLINERILWAEKLNLLSLKLPPGVWLDKISITGKGFALSGSVVSLEKQELNLINKFLTGLKDDKSFFKDFNTLELGPSIRETIGGYDVVDFTINGVLK